MPTHYSRGLIADDGSILAAPSADGTVGQIIQTDGSGGLSFVDAGSGDVTKVGTPANNQVGVWTGDGTIEGDADLIFDGDNLGVGAASPAARVEINAATASRKGLIVQTTDDSTTNNLVEFQDSAGSNLSSVKSDGTVYATSGTYNGSKGFFFTGDTNTGISNPASDTIAFNCGGVDRFRIDTGSINIFAAGSSAAPAVRRVTDGDTGFYWGSTANQFGITTGGTAAIFADENQRVGVGETSPTATLHLAASTTAKASLCIPSGTAPTSPVNGDIWSDGSDILVRLGGTTYTLTKT